jgi:hypothetical protein
MKPAMLPQCIRRRRARSIAQVCQQRTCASALAHCTEIPQSAARAHTGAAQHCSPRHLPPTATEEQGRGRDVRAHGLQPGTARHRKPAAQAAASADSGACICRRQSHDSGARAHSTIRHAIASQPRKRRFWVGRMSVHLPRAGTAPIDESGMRARSTAQRAIAGQPAAHAVAWVNKVNVHLPKASTAHVRRSGARAHSTTRHAIAGQPRKRRLE